ncbi:MAG: 2-hydroxyacid dehydrogenase [Burkholderiaceae bacterium]
MIKNPVVLVYGQTAVSRAAQLEPRLSPGWQLLVWDVSDGKPEDFESMLAQADVIVGGPIPTPAWPPTPRLKLIQVPWAGYEWARPENVPQNVPLCNTYEHEVPIAEYVMLTILESRIGLRRMDSTFRKSGWDGKGPGNSVYHGEIQGATIGVIGYGHIGEEVARRAAAFGISVIGIRRSTMPTPPELQWLGTPDRTAELLAQSDYVLIACDLNDATRGMVDAEFLDKMKDDAWIINVARGAIIDEDALYDALVNHHIGGAIIDTWYNYPDRTNPEPWPSNQRFHDLPNTILSAHESGWTKELQERRWQFVADNIERLRREEPLQNIAMNGLAQTGDPAR